MAPNETSALLRDNHNQQYTSDYNSNNVTGYHAVDSNNHIVYINKDVSECDPVFSLNEYSSSLTLDELLPYKLDPWWQNLRRIMFLTFWLTLLLTFLSACLLSYLRVGHISCNILEKQTINRSDQILASSANIIFSASTPYPTLIANVLSDRLLEG